MRIPEFVFEAWEKLCILKFLSNNQIANHYTQMRCSRQVASYSEFDIKFCLRPKINQVVWNFEWTLDKMWIQEQNIEENKDINVTSLMCWNNYGTQRFHISHNKVTLHVHESCVLVWSYLNCHVQLKLKKPWLWKYHLRVKCAWSYHLTKNTNKVSNTKRSKGLGISLGYRQKLLVWTWHKQHILEYNKSICAYNELLDKCYNNTDLIILKIGLNLTFKF